MSSRTLTIRQLNRATLSRQLLLQRADLDVGTAVEHLGALQAQEPRPPYLSLWNRIARFDAAALTAALHARTLVRVTLWRGTLHVVTAAEYLRLRGTIAATLEAGLRVLGDRAAAVDPEVVVPVARELLRQRPRTFDDLRAELSARFPSMNDRALGYCVRMFVPLVMVPTQDRWGFPRVSEFALASQWLGHEPDPQDDLEALVRRYLSAFGPASVADLQEFVGRGGLNQPVNELRDRLAVYQDEQGRELFDLPDLALPDPDVEAPVRLLPDFDSLLLAHRDRSRVIDDAHRPLVATKNLRIKATVLVDGRVAATWALKRTAKKATIVVTPFASLAPRSRAAVQREAELMARFVEPAVPAVDVSFD